jgi:glucan phosphoethanolaminetransferase (alkaline phosphatase superfamily)
MKILFALLQILLGSLFIVFISIITVLFLYLLVTYAKIIITLVIIVLLLIISYCIGSVLCMYFKSTWDLFSKFHSFMERLEENGQKEKE